MQKTRRIIKFSDLTQSFYLFFSFDRGEVFSLYQYKEILKGCKPHPGDIVEAGSLAALAPPPVTYPLADSLPEELITGGKLSSLQLEGIVYAVSILCFFSKSSVAKALPGVDDGVYIGVYALPDTCQCNLICQSVTDI